MALSTGLQLYYAFEEMTGLTTTNVTGVANVGTWNGTLGSQWTTGKLGGGGNFNGSDNYITSAIAPTQANVFSMAAWILPTNLSTYSILTFNATNGQNLRMTAAGTLIFSKVGSGTFATSDAVITAGVWQHVAFTMDASNVWTFYINGVAHGTGTSVQSFDVTHNLCVGREAGFASFFTGKIDEAAYWNRALAADEVGQLFNKGNGLPYPLTGYSSLYYKLQSKIEALSRKSGNTSPRLTDQQVAVYGGRGVNRGSDELVYLRGKNGDAAGVNTHSADAWQTFAGANGVTGTKRADQSEREMPQEGNFP